jgi:superfamily II DNA or RNA helicase
MKFEEKTKVKVRNRPELGLGEVFGCAEDRGEYKVDVVFEKDGQRILMTFPRESLESVPDIFDRFRLGKSDHPIDFFLKQLAYQFPLENSGGELSNSKTDLLPHQILLTHQIVQSRRRRYLVADEVGLGKTIEVGMIIRELVARNEYKRVLVVCPAGLTINWQKEMLDYFRLYFDIFGIDFMDTQPSAWDRHPLAIVSIDTIKKPNRLDKFMSAPDWNLIVFDEAHHLTRKRYGNKIQFTQNFRLAERLKGKTHDLLFLTATPHQGDSYQFWSLIQLLDDQLFESPEAIQDHRGLLGRVMFRRTKREVTDANGKPIFMRRKVHTQKFQLSLKEQRFYEKLTDYLREGYNAAGISLERTTSQQRAVGFIMATFQKIMSSSPRAIKQALRRRLIALYARRQMALESESQGKPPRPDISSKIVQYQNLMRKLVIDLLSYSRRDMDYTEADAYIAALKQRLKKRPKFEEEVTQWALDSSETEEEAVEIEANIPDEEKKLKELIDLVDESADRKFDTLLRAIEQIKRENASEKMIVFTQYLETLYFLQEELGKYYPAKKIAVVKGGPLEDKIAACESFWEENGAQFLLSTSAGGEGINLQVCRILYNYDLPWNPMAVEQRIGRIHRYGQTETVQVYNLVAEETIEEKVYKILEDKLLDIASAIGKVDSVTGEVTEDFRSEILGFLSSSTNYTDLYSEALVNRNYKRTEKEIAEAILKAKEASEALRQLTQDLSTFNLEYYRELKGKFSLEDLRTFTEKAILRVGGSFIPAGDIIQITVPPILKKYPNVASRYEIVTFSRKVATRKKNVDLLGLGHPLIDALISHFKSDAISGEVLNACGEGTGSGLLARYILTADFEDGTTREFYENLVIEGENISCDLDLIKYAKWQEGRSERRPDQIKDKAEMLTRNIEAKIYSNYDGVVNIRKKCVGIQAMN